jgi:hypothetical protein
MVTKEEKEALRLLKQEEDEFLKETSELEKETERLKQEQEGEYLCKVIEAIKTSVEVLPDGKEYFVGEYDFSNIFHTVHGNFSGFYSDYVNIPKNKIVLQEDGSLIAEVLEDGSNFLISKNDPKYRQWKEGKRQLWKAKYVFRIKLGQELGEESYENLKEKLQL